MGIEHALGWTRRARREAQPGGHVLAEVAPRDRGAVFGEQAVLQPQAGPPAVETPSGRLPSITTTCSIVGQSGNSEFNNVARLDVTASARSSAWLMIAAR